MDFLNLLRAQWDRSLAIGCAVIALFALLLGYIGVSGTPRVAAQLPYFISGGLFGVFLLTIAATLWLSADLRDEWRELRLLRLQREAAAERELQLEALESPMPTDSPAKRARPQGAGRPSRNDVGAQR